MRILTDHACPGQPAQALAVLLPGALQRPEDFVQAGFVDAVRARRLSLDLAMVDLGLQHIGEVTDGAALQRLHEGLMQSAQRKSYRAVWLAGISIGGFMALAYAGRYPGGVTGLCLLAPYPGNRMLTGAIRAAGGLRNWHARCEHDDDECRVWQWLKAYDPACGPHIYLGYGLADRFAAGQQLLAGAIDPAWVDTVAGDHDWPVWQKLWNNFLDRAALPPADSMTDHLS